MARKLRIALISTATVGGVLVAGLWTAYFAVRQVRPFYHQALTLDPHVLAEGGRELETRATALYSDTREAGQWHALFTAEQINGWLATQLASGSAGQLPSTISDPRVALAPDVLTLGFRTSQSGIEAVVSVDASVFLTDDGAVAIRFLRVSAGALPLPVLQVADELAIGCQELGLPVRWTQQDGEPIAIVEISSKDSDDKRRLYLDAIELNEGELYVAGHTEVGEAAKKVVGQESPRKSAAKHRSDEADPDSESVELTGYELLLTPGDENSALEIARERSEFLPNNTSERNAKRSTNRRDK